MKATDKRPLGRTKLKVTVLGLGTATLGNLYAPVSDADAHDTVKTAFDAGVRFVDTAPFYGHGWSEHRVGEALRGVVHVGNVPPERDRRPVDVPARDRGEHALSLDHRILLDEGPR